MGSHAVITLSVLAVMIVLFISDRLPLDLVAMAAAYALALFGVLSPQEARWLRQPDRADVGRPVHRGGRAADHRGHNVVGGQLARIAGGGELRLVMVLMVTSAVLSSFMSSTGTVAVLLPVAITLAKRARISPSKVLMLRSG